MHFNTQTKKDKEIAELKAQNELIGKRLEELEKLETQETQNPPNL